MLTLNPINDTYCCREARHQGRRHKFRYKLRYKEIMSNFQILQVDEPVCRTQRSHALHMCFACVLLYRGLKPEATLYLCGTLAALITFFRTF